MSGRISSRVDGEIYRSLSRERRSGYGTIRARSGSRERTEDRGQRLVERGRRADSSGPRAHIPRPSPSPTGTTSAPDVVSVNEFSVINHTDKDLYLISTSVFAGSRVPRFDPTAYIQDRQRRQKEAEIKKLVSSLCEYTPVLRVVAAQACFSVSDKGRCEGTCWHHPCSPREAVHVPEKPILS